MNAANYSELRRSLKSYVDRVYGEREPLIVTRKNNENVVVMSVDRYNSLVFTTKSWDDYLYWQRNDRRMVRRIGDLIRDIHREPFEGIGKPEPLKHQLQGVWSRRIDSEHRLVYEIFEDEVRIIACRYHY